MLFIFCDYALFLKSAWIWLKRCTHCRGFGVQSPSAYRFIRYVINEHYPYYAYEELKEHMNMLSKHQHKLGRLFFRLANFWQPDFCYCDQPQFLKYAQAGSHRMKSGAISEFLEKSAFHCVPNTDRILIWVDLEYAADVLDELLTKCTSQTLLVVNGINKRIMLCGKNFSLMYMSVLLTIYIIVAFCFSISPFTSSIMR